MAQRRADPLASRRAVDETCGQSKADLVRVGDAIRSNELILSKQLHEIEVRQDRVEHGQVALVFERDVYIEQPGFECLDKSVLLACAALERQTGVDARYRYASGQHVVDAGALIVQPVIRVPQRHRGRQVHSGAGKVETELLCAIEAPSGDPDIAIEIDELYIGLESNDAFAPLPFEQHLRHALVGAVDVVE